MLVVITASPIKVEVVSLAVVLVKGAVLSAVVPREVDLVRVRVVEAKVKVGRSAKAEMVKTVVKAAKFIMGSLLL